MMQLITRKDYACDYGIAGALHNNDRMRNNPVLVAKNLTGLTGERLAERMGISAPHFSRLKNGKTPTTSQHIKMLAEICDISEQDFYRLLAGDEKASEASSTQVSGTSPTEKTLFIPRVFEQAVEETRTLDVKYAGGKARSRSFAKLQNAIYEFISEEGGVFLEGDDID